MTVRSSIEKTGCRICNLSPFLKTPTSIGDFSYCSMPGL
ncbi:hypothetical protein DCCM_0520 [Desulfocucumis palustris]|uniref:Uncharacterized protein n=1 Tax=Desulfocucumis palustris TaxID=1898651 RepID=A0A2L2XDM7_9FIRM|nr:hypothetical protein DCCM_0520 [Desulfocucumis palustris]